MVITRFVLQFIKPYTRHISFDAGELSHCPSSRHPRQSRKIYRNHIGRIKWFILLLMFMLPASAMARHAGDAKFSLARMPWRAAIGTGCSVKTIARINDIGTYIFNCDGKSEAFPHISMQNTGPRDWRGFNQLKLKLRLMSKDAGVQAGGEHVTVILYDGNTRRENMPGDPSAQQRVASFKLWTGGWQTVDLNLRRVTRSDVLGIAIYVYVMPYAYPHAFEVQLAQAEVTGAAANQVCFDSHIFDANALRGKSGRPVGMLRTTDGLELQIGAKGGIRRWFINGKSYGNGREQLSGFMLRDVAANTPPVMVGGKITAKANHIVQHGVVKQLGLQLHAVYKVKGDTITVQGKVTNLRGGTRAITVYFGIPVNLLNWQWDAGLEKTSYPFRHLYSIPSLEEPLTGYPVCALSTPDAGLAMGIRLDQPSVYRFVINPHQHLLYIAFDFALTDGVRWNKKPLSSANFSFIIYRCDPQWGLRSSLQRYYQFFPQFFTNRVAHGGGWDYSWGRAQAKQTPEQYLSGGYRFDEGATGKDAKWDHEHGVLNLLYIEPQFVQFSMGDYQTPTYQRAMERLIALTRGDDAEWARFLKLHYSKADCGHFWSKHYSGMNLRPFLSDLLKAALVSGMYNANENLILGLANRKEWIGNGGVGAMIPCDLSPDIPGGLGLFDYYHCMLPNIKAFEFTTGFHADGFELDSFNSAVPNDYRRSLFKYSSFPLSFAPRTYQPMIPATFSSVQWLKWISPLCHQHKEVLMANISDQVTFSSPYIDIFGNESPVVRHPALLRSLAYHRLITYLPYTNQPKTGVQYNLLWDDYPGRGIKLSVLAPIIPVLDKLYRAGWEPVTWAHSAQQLIHIERFGIGNSCYLSLYNPTSKIAKTQVKVNWKQLGIQCGPVHMIYPEKQYLPQVTAGFSIMMLPEETIVVSLH